MPKHIKYTREVLEPLVKQAVSVAQVARMLGRPLCGGTHAHISRVIKKMGLDTSHFTGQACNRGKVARNRQTADEILTTGYDYRADASRIRRSMMEKGAKMCCVKCGIGPEYNGLPLILEIDHINNDWGDNRFENLQFMCPNCHAQKTTSDGAKAKFLKQINSPLVPVIPEHVSTKGQPRVVDEGGQLSLGLYRKKPRQTPPDVNWRTQPKPHLRKHVRPPAEELKRLVWERPSTDLEREYGWCDSLIVKWCRIYGIEKPPRGYWAKRATGMSHEEAIRPIEQEIVEQIRAKLLAGQSMRSVAIEFGLSRWAIPAIRDGMTA